MIAPTAARFGDPAAVFQSQLASVGDSVTLRRQTGGTWAEVETPVEAVLDFTPAGIFRAQQAGAMVGSLGESGGVALYLLPDADIRVSDTFQRGGALYRVVWVGPEGRALAGGRAVYRIAFATAQKAPGAA